MAQTTAYNCNEASKETLEAMLLRCQEEGHCFEKLELSNGVVIKKCKWCPAAVQV